MAKSTVRHFLKLLEESKLLDDRQLSKARSLDSGETLPETIARKLIKRRYLTRWQARMLLAGKKGSFVLGNYKLLEPLGHGGMGSVFKAHQSAMTRIVALKVVSSKLLKDERTLARFKREIRAAAALDHPHIIHAFDAGCVNNTYFLVMEYAAGRDLKHWIAATGKSPVMWSCECIRQAALGLQYAHERGIVHRDIKPSNLLLIENSVDDRPLVKIVDFGLARAALDIGGDPRLTRVGQGLGTSDYVAPEQADDSTQSDTRSDIFSLGCTHFELLTGQLPFSGSSPFERLLARFKHDAPFISSLRSDIPAGLDEVVARMLARDPARRFQSPAEAAEALLPFSWKDEAAAVGAGSVRSLESGNPADAGATNPDRNVNRFLESLSAQLSSRSFPTLAKPDVGHNRRFWLPWAIAAIALLLVTIISWVRG
jgi:serine/threonine protein kinase